MKITCLQENLKKILNTTQNIIGKNLTLPILNNILIETDGGQLKASSTNLEIGISTKTSCKIEKEGAITCPAKILTGLVNNLPNKKIELEVKNNNITIKCENYKSNLRGLPADDFPIIPKIKDGLLVEIKNNLLKEGLAQVVGAASLSESRPEITGVLIKFEKNNVKLVATDSFRLAEKTIFNQNIKQDNQPDIIIPQKTAQELIRILNEQGGATKIMLGSSQVLFETEEAQIVSRLIDGQYPPYQQIIPQNYTTQIIINKEELLSVIRVAGLFSGRVNDVRFLIKNNKLEVLSQDAELGDNKAQINIEGKGKDVEIIFNYRYFLDGLNNIKSKKVFLGINNENSPAVIKEVEDESLVYIIMPIKTS